jgi:hypothetical protein
MIGQGIGAGIGGMLAYWATGGEAEAKPETPKADDVNKLPSVPDVKPVEAVSPAPKQPAPRISEPVKKIKKPVAASAPPKNSIPPVVKEQRKILTAYNRVPDKSVAMDSLSKMVTRNIAEQAARTKKAILDSDNEGKTFGDEKNISTPRGKGFRYNGKGGSGSGSGTDPGRWGKNDGSSGGGGAYGSGGSKQGSGGGGGAQTNKNVKLTTNAKNVAIDIAVIFKKAGLPDSAIAGMFKNINDESKFDPTIIHYNDNRRFSGELAHAHGLFQMNGAEWQGYSNWLKTNHPSADWRDHKLQAEYQVYNLQKNYPKLWAILIDPNVSKEEKSVAFTEQYEKPSQSNQERRNAEARRGIPSLDTYTVGGKADTTSGPNVNTDGQQGGDETREHLLARIQLGNPRMSPAECVLLAKQITGTENISTPQWLRGGDNEEHHRGVAMATFMDRDRSPSQQYDAGHHGKSGAGTTHVVIFDSYIMKDGKIIGANVYSQSKSHGPHFHAIYTGDKRGGIWDWDNYKNIIDSKTGRLLGGGPPVNPDFKPESKPETDKDKPTATLDGAEKPASGEPYSVKDDTEKGPGKTGDLSDVKGVIWHHSVAPSVGATEAALKWRGYSTHYIMDRDGTIYQYLPDGSQGRHIKPTSGFSSFTGKPLDNNNTIGIEVVAADDKDVTPEQVKAGVAFSKWLAAKYHLNPEDFYGHGQVNPGHKQATEGKTIVDAARKALREDKEHPAPAPPIAVLQPKPTVKRNLIEDLLGSDKKETPTVKPLPPASPRSPTAKPNVLPGTEQSPLSPTPSTAVKAHDPGEVGKPAPPESPKPASASATPESKPESENKDAPTIVPTEDASKLKIHSDDLNDHEHAHTTA